MKDKEYNNQIAYGALKQENNSLSKKYDSGCDGILPECRTCRFHRPFWIFQSCTFDVCPYSTTPVSTRKKRKEN